MVVEKDLGIPELNQFEFVSYAQPPPIASAAKCEPYDLFAWVSHTLLSKAKHKFTNTLLHQHDQLTTHRLSTIAHHLRSGETVNLKSVPFLCEASYNLTDYDTMLSMIDELEEFVPLVDDAATSHTVLIPLLTALAKFEDPVVRDTAVTLLSRVGNHMNKQDVLLSFIPLVKALATGESYAGRVSSTGLLHIAYLSATTELKAELKLLYYKLRRDHMLVVRKAAASNRGIFAVTDEVGVLDGARIWEVWAMVQDFVQNLFSAYQAQALYNREISKTKHGPPPKKERFCSSVGV